MHRYMRIQDIRTKPLVLDNLHNVNPAATSNYF